jgi:hypothetical protein
MEESILKDFIIIRRDQFRSFESGEISYGELITYIWLCRTADMYGYAHVRSYGWLAELLPIKFKANTVGVMMRSLRSHKFIDYSDRQGSRSGFKVTIGFWPVGKGKFRQLDNYVSKEIDDSYKKVDLNQSHLTEDVVSENHKLPRLLNGLKSVEKMASIHDVITSRNNDIKKKKENDNDSHKSFSFKKRDYSVGGFVPSSPEEARCLKISQVLKEKNVSFCIGIYRKHGMAPLELAVEEFKKADLQTIDNPRAFFNSLVQKFL